MRPLMLFVKLSSWIVFPLIIALFVGKWIDRVFSTEPMGTLICITFSFILSLGVLFREARKAIKDLAHKSESDRTKSS